MDWEENRERKPYQNVLCGGKICFQLKIKVQITEQSSEIQIHRTFTWIFFFTSYMRYHPFLFQVIFI